MRRSSWSAVAFCIIVASWILPGTGQAQTAGRRAATLASLSGSPIFFHGQQVVVQADAVGDGVLTYLVDGEDRLVALDVPPPPAGTAERLEVSGRFYDVGRLEPDDSRMGNLPFARLSESLLGKPWPGVGELLVLALYARYQEAGESFADSYVEMLAAGGSDWPHRIMQPLGVDLTDPGFWDRGLAMVEQMVAEAEELAG